jgi:site-specific DNA-methyltransferase (adenine-specific)
MLELNRLYNTDCMEGMKQFPDKYFELAIVDPPYGINAGKMTMGSGKHKFSKDKAWDESIPDEFYFKELFRVSQNQIIWGGNYFTEYLPPSKDWILWDKCNPNLSFAEGELAWVRKGKNLRIYKYYSAQVEDGGKIHPTQKPVKLYAWILKNYAKQGYKILDTHAGSASSLIACYNYKFDYIGFEIDKDYYKAAQKRMDTVMAQVTMF